ncbi:MAG: filamentous hemagglutinin N-terminal domain-containing protein [Pseudomonadota bacterium]
MNRNRKNRQISAILIAVMLSVSPALTWAEAIIDASWGRAPRTLTGNFTIPETLGKLSGANLFHSFEKFNIHSGEAARFTTTTRSIVNVISRVSGTQPTSINGLLQLQALNGGKPNFFFINPNGVTFGAGAQIDVPAAFHVSTANNLQFADGTVFSAGTGPDNTLTVAAPEAFGFLGGNQSAAAIRFIVLNKKPAITESEASGSTGDEGAAAQDMLLFGNTLDITAGTIEIANSSLGILDGAIRLVATGAKPATVNLTLQPTAGFGGSINITSSELVVRGTTTGKPIYFQGKDIRLFNSSVTNEDLSGLASDMGVATRGDSSVHFNADHVVLNHTLLRTTGILKGGNGGSIDVEASKDVSLFQSTIYSQFGGLGGATRTVGGDIKITAPYLSIDNGSLIGALAYSPDHVSPVQVGSILFQANKEIAITGKSYVVAVNYNPEPSEIIDPVFPGKIRLISPSLVLKREGAIIVLPGTTDAGVTIESPRLSNGSLSSLAISGDGTGGVDTAKTGFGHSGAINIRGSDITINGVLLISCACGPGVGNAGPITVSAPGAVTLGPGTLIAADTNNAAGNAGSINISGSSVRLDGAAISSSVFNNATGNAGAISLSSAGGVSLRNNAMIRSDTKGPGGAGSVKIDASSLFVDKSTISSRALAGSSGQTGDVTVNVGNRLTVINGASIDIRNDAVVPDAGQVLPTKLSLTASDIVIGQGAQITAASTGNVSASNIAINFGNILTVQDAAITTTAKGGNGGAIAVNGGQTIRLQNGEISTSASGVADNGRDTGNAFVGNGGNIDVNAASLILETGAIQANAGAKNASGGRVSINTGVLIVSGGTLLLDEKRPVALVANTLGLNVIQSAAPDGMSGEIRLVNPPLDIARSLASLKPPVIDASGLSRDLCHLGAGSSLTKVGHANLSAPPLGAFRSQGLDSNTEQGSALNNPNLFSCGLASN